VASGRSRSSCSSAALRARSTSSSRPRTRRRRRRSYARGASRAAPSAASTTSVEPAGVEPADVVVLNRVVCCYPDYERLLTAAAQHARRLLVFSYPRRNAVSRLVVRVQNIVFALLRREFRTFTHPPARMLAVLERRGLRASFVHRGLVWQVAGLER
jgi:hypothetical protein